MIDKYNPIANPIKITCKAAALIQIDLLKKFQGNLKTLSDNSREKLLKSICLNGFTAPFFVWLHNDVFNLLDGHQRVETLLYMRELGWEIPELPVAYIEADSVKDAKSKLLVITSQYGEFNPDEVQNWIDEIDNEIAESIRLVDQELDLKFQDKEEATGTAGDDNINLSIEKRTTAGDLWELGEHRLLCGDSREPEHVKLVMNGKVAELVSTDPPYGMKKEIDGVLNDNMNFDDLLKFNKKWIDLSFENLKPIGSFYCWGMDEPLMDIHVNILKPMIKAEKVTFRNLITWNKGSAQGRKSKEFRKYPVADEKCLFVMAGVQGFNDNSNNYFQGWEVIRKYIDDQVKETGWKVKEIADFFGFHTRMVGHWRTKSQFSLIKEDQYLKLREESGGMNFKKPYSEILDQYEKAKSNYIDSRAYFDNTHESMSNVWEFPQCKGAEKEEAGNHATPKPIALCTRIILSSSQSNDLILDLFLGSGSNIIAAEKTGRRCYGLELDPHNCDIIVNRFIEWCSSNERKPEIKLNGELYNV